MCLAAHKQEISILGREFSTIFQAAASATDIKASVVGCQKMTPARKSCRVRLQAASLKIFTDVGMLGNVESENRGADFERSHASEGQVHALPRGGVKKIHE